MVFTSLKDINDSRSGFYLDEDIYSSHVVFILRVFNSSDINSYDIQDAMNDETGKLENILGIWYSYVKNDKINAEKCYRKSMEKKFAISFYNLYLMLQTDDIKKNISIELDLLTRAIECDNVPPYFYGLFAQVKINDHNTNNRDSTNEKKVIEALSYAIQINDPIGLLILTNILYLQDKLEEALKYSDYSIYYCQKSKHHINIKEKCIQLHKDIKKKLLSRTSSDIDNDNIKADEMDTKRMKI